jgi:hypothetical protein
MVLDVGDFAVPGNGLFDSAFDDRSADETSTGDQQQRGL